MLHNSKQISPGFVRIFLQYLLWYFSQFCPSVSVNKNKHYSSSNNEMMERVWTLVVLFFSHRPRTCDISSHNDVIHAWNRFDRLKSPATRPRDPGAPSARELKRKLSVCGVCFCFWCEVDLRMGCILNSCIHTRVICIHSARIHCSCVQCSHFHSLSLIFCSLFTHCLQKIVIQRFSTAKCSDPGCNVTSCRWKLLECQ